MHWRRQVWWVLLGVVVLLIGCSRDSGCSPQHHAEGEKLAAANVTPAFRNLGKRGESTL